MSVCIAIQLTLSPQRRRKRREASLRKSATAAQQSRQQLEDEMEKQRSSNLQQRMKVHRSKTGADTLNLSGQLLTGIPERLTENHAKRSGVLALSYVLDVDLSVRRLSPPLPGRPPSPLTLPRSTPLPPSRRSSCTASTTSSA